MHVHGLSLNDLVSKNIFQEPYFELTKIVNDFALSLEVRRPLGGLNSIVLVWDNRNKQIKHNDTHQDSKHDIDDPSYRLLICEIDLRIFAEKNLILVEGIHWESFFNTLLSVQLEIDHGKREYWENHDGQERNHTKKALDNHFYQCSLCFENLQS